MSKSNVHIYDPITKSVYAYAGWIENTCESEEEFLTIYPDGKVAIMDYEDEEHRNGDIFTYEDGNVKWILIFETWYRPYDGHLHYHVLMTNPEKEVYRNGTCGGIDEDFLIPATDEEKQLLFSTLEKQGYVWDSIKKKLIKRNE